MDINESVDNNSLLGMKLDDISLIYSGFKEFIKDHYITSEEILDLMCRKVTESAKIRGSIIAFDGFTGFTPVQNRLILELMKYCKGVWITVIMQMSMPMSMRE